MKLKFSVFVLLTLWNQLADAQATFDESRLDAFIADISDNTNARHYRLVSQQSAIHKWLMRDCMSNLGFSDEANIDSEPWREALYGKYAYCQDHHIPGIDPPCPDEAVVLTSVNSACYQRTHDQIDWSHNIMHEARGDLINEWEIDASNPVIKLIESDWSDCMNGKGYSFYTRLDMYSWFSESGTLSSDVNVHTNNEDQVMQSADACFVSTQYFQRRTQHSDFLKAQHFRSRRPAIETLLRRYEQAERTAGRAIESYCYADRDTIVRFYEQEKYTDVQICR